MVERRRKAKDSQSAVCCVSSSAMYEAEAKETVLCGEAGEVRNKRRIGVFVVEAKKQWS